MGPRVPFAPVTSWVHDFLFSFSFIVIAAIKAVKKCFQHSAHSDNTTLLPNRSPVA